MLLRLHRTTQLGQLLGLRRRMGLDGALILRPLTMPEDVQLEPTENRLTTDWYNRRAVRFDRLLRWILCRPEENPNLNRRCIGCSLLQDLTFRDGGGVQ